MGDEDKNVYKKGQRIALVEIEKGLLNKTRIGLNARFAQGWLGFIAIRYYLIPAGNNIMNLKLLRPQTPFPYGSSYFYHTIVAYARFLRNGNNV